MRREERTAMQFISDPLVGWNLGEKRRIIFNLGTPACPCHEPPFIWVINLRLPRPLMLPLRREAEEEELGGNVNV